MANWTILKEAIASVIKTNDNQEITGQLLQNALNNIITNVGENATFAGIATPTTNPGTPDGPVFYIATTAGSYSNFGSLEVSKGETAILQWNNGTWTKNAIESDRQRVDDEPTAGSENLVKSGGTYKYIRNTSVIDVNNISGQEPSTLEAALALVPNEYRKGFALMYFRANSVLQLYGFKSGNPTDENWNTAAYWIKYLNEQEVANLNNSLSLDIKNTALINASEITNTELSLAETLPLVPDKYRKGLAFITVREGGSNNLHLYGFISRNPTEQNWNNTANWKRFAREDEVDNAIANLNNSLSLDIKNTALINASEITNTELSLAETLPLVPDKYRKGLAFITVREGGSNNLHLYGFISRNPTEQNWNNTANWKRFAREDEVDNAIANLNNSVNLPNMVVSYRNTGGVFYVYMRKPGTNIYFMLDLHHVINNDELVYLDIWRLSGEGQLCKYENGQFVNLNKNLLLGVENEFTMHFDGAADFTGGYHGDERIDTQGSFVKFFIDGKELSSAELEADFVKQCNSFYMLSNATLHETTTDGETPVAGHPVVGRHIKKTIFGDCGFTCENRVDFDFTAESLASKDVNALFTGLVCVHKDCALNAYTDDYIIRDVSSGAEVAINIYDSCKGKVCFYNNTTGLSCVVDSHAIGENDDNLYIRLQDRANDSKYYRYATNNGVRTVTTGDKYLSKVKAKWDYKFEQE